MQAIFKSPRFRTWTRRLVPLAFYALLLAFLAAYIRSIDFSKLVEVDIAWWFVALATLLYLGKIYLGAFIWLTILRSLGARDVHMNRQLVAIYGKAWLGRYIPGTAPWILIKIYYAAKHGISKEKLAIGSLLEAGLQIVTMLLFSLALLVFDKRLDVLGGGFKLLMIVVALAGIVVLVPSIFNRLASVAYKLLWRRPLSREHFMTRETIGKGTALYIVDSIIFGFALFFIAKAIDPALSYHNLAFVMGVGSLAGAASMLALFAPSGLGVREGIQLVLLSLIMPKELALAVTIATRLWTVAGDFIFYGLSAMVARQKPQASTSNVSDS